MRVIRRFLNWLDPIPLEHRDLASAFDATIQAYLRQVISPLGLVGGLYMLLWLAGDFILYRPVFWQLLPLRLGLVVACWVPAVLAYRGQAQRSVYLIFYASIVVQALITELQLVVNGDPTGPHWVWIFFLTVLSGTFPWPAIWALRSGLTFLIIHLGAGILTGALIQSPVRYFLYVSSQYLGGTRFPTSRKSRICQCEIEPIDNGSALW